ncbi:competence protein ComK [Paenisporosarcina indica]|uniref:competence protein ComK n=1 Tax=Paenisporosarcina indica TaxID=650093 RepID=UPI00094FB4BE|nr:competence protein ComK [Paenisporosarcina indica]
MLQCDSYYINEDTLTLEPVFVDGFQSRIGTMHGVYYSKMSIRSLLEEACIRYASTFDGRIQAIQKFMEYRHKTPLLIIPDTVGAVPTISHLQAECVWLFNHHYQINALSPNVSEIIFSNGYTIQVNVSKKVITKQQQRLYSTMEAYRSMHRKKIYIEKSRTVLNLE